MPSARPIPAQLVDRPFTTATAEQLAVNARMLQGRRFRQVLHGVHVSAARPASPQLAYDAARLLLPEGAAASHHLAAELFGAPVPPTDVLHMAVAAPGRPYAVAGLRVHRIGPKTQTVGIDGRTATAPVPTFLALAAHLSLLDLVILGDALVRQSLVTPAELVAAAAANRGRGVRRAREAAALVRPGVDSPMETRLRLLLTFAGLPEPSVNVSVVTAEGLWLARPDLSFFGERVAVEYDGRHHIAREAQWASDLPRRERLERHGWRVIVVIASQLYGDPVGVVLRVAAALRERGRDVRPAFALPWQALVAQM